MHTQRVCILTAYAYSHSHICLIFLRRTMRAVIRASVVGHLRNAARSVHTAKQSGSQPVFKGVVFGLWGVSISSSCVYGTRICVWVFTHTGACIFKCVRSRWSHGPRLLRTKKVGRLHEIFRWALSAGWRRWMVE